jgi:hypothetical protein
MHALDVSLVEVLLAAQLKNLEVDGFALGLPVLLEQLLFEILENLLLSLHFIPHLIYIFCSSQS